MTMLFSGPLSESDFLSAQRLHHKWSSAKWLAAGGTSLLAVAACGALIMTGRPRGLGVILLCGVFGAWIGGAVTRFGYIPWKGRKVFRQQQALHRPFEMSWDSQVLTCRNATGESRIPWSDFVRWKENERLFLLYVSDVLFQLVPKQIFPNQDAVTAFRRVLAEHIVAR